MSTKVHASEHEVVIGIDRGDAVFAVTCNVCPDVWGGYEVTDYTALDMSGLPVTLTREEEELVYDRAEAKAVDADIARHADYFREEGLLRIGGRR